MVANLGITSESFYFQCWENEGKAVRAEQILRDNYYMCLGDMNWLEEEEVEREETEEGRSRSSPTIAEPTFIIGRSVRGKHVKQNIN